MAVFHILYGSNDFSLREELECIKNGLGDREALASNTTYFEGKQVTPNQLMDSCMALPFLGTHRLVIVEGLFSRFGSSSESTGSDTDARPGKSPGEWKSLGQKVSEMPPSTVLVLVDGDIRKGNALLNALSKSAQVSNFPRLKAGKLKDWIRGRVKQEGGEISPGAVNLLAATAGENLGVLANEIQKLLLYTAGRTIKEEDVREVVSYAREASVFTMVDALIEGRAARAAPLMHELLQEGAAAPFLLFMITRQVRLLLQLKELLQSHHKRADMMKRLGIYQDFMLDRAVEQCRSYTMERLEQVYLQLLDTDIAIKRGWLKGDLALDLLMADLCH